MNEAGSFEFTLAAIPNIDFYSLQVGPAAEQLADTTMQITDLATGFKHVGYGSCDAGTGYRHQYRLRASSFGRRSWPPDLGSTGKKSPIGDGVSKTRGRLVLLDADFPRPGGWDDVFVRVAGRTCGSLRPINDDCA